MASLFALCWDVLSEHLDTAEGKLARLSRSTLDLNLVSTDAISIALVHLPGLVGWTPGDLVAEGGSDEHISLSQSVDCALRGEDLDLSHVSGAIEVGGPCGVFLVEGSLASAWLVL